MTPKELIQRVLDLKPVPRQAVSLVAGGLWALVSNGITLEAALREPAEKIADVLHRVFTDIKTDVMPAPAGYNTIIVGAVGGKLKFRETGSPDVVDTAIKKLSDIDRIDTDMIKKNEHILQLLAITKLLAKKNAGEKYFELMRRGPFTLAGLIYGAENLMREIYRDPQAVHHLLDWTADLYLKYVQLYIDNGVDYVWMSEPTASGDMVSKKHFEHFVVPALKKVYDGLKAKGMRTGLHICGNIEDRLDLINGIGAEFLSVDYKVSLAKCREVFDGKMAFGGNMDPVGIMLQETPAGVRKASEDCIAAAGGSTGFILMPGCDIAAATPIANIRAMVAAARRQ